MPAPLHRLRFRLTPTRPTPARLLLAAGGATAVAAAAWVDPVAATLLAGTALAAVGVVRHRHHHGVRRATGAVLVLTLLAAFGVAAAVVRWSVPDTPILVQRTATGALAAGRADLAGAAGAVAATRAPTRGHPLEVLGFVASDFADSSAGVDRDAGAVSDLAATGLTLGATAGTVDALPGTDTLLRAHLNEARGELVVSNYDTAQGAFNGARATRAMTDPDTRAALARAIADRVRRGGWDGVVLDLEALGRSARAPYVALTRQVKADLPGRAVLVATPADGSARGEQLAGYDLPALAGAADRIVWMAYDQHAPGTAPGPVAALGWVRASLAVARADVPAGKLLLGIAGYGYAWTPGRSARSLTAEQVATLERTRGARVRFDPVSAELTLTLPDGTRAWYSDARAFATRAALAAGEHLAGVALWRVGAEQPATLAGLPGPPVKHPGLSLGGRPVANVGAHPVVALTFDDGPDPAWTPQILAVLRREHVPGTFFVIGRQAEEHADLVRQEVADGDVVGNHTYTHPDMDAVPQWRAEEEILRGRLVIAGLTGRDPALYRGPYGNGDAPDGAGMTRDELATTLGQAPMRWTVDPRDWSRPGVPTIVRTVLARSSNRAVVLLHDGGGDRAQTVAALPRIIAALKARGYTFATLDEVDGGVRAPYLDHRSLGGRAAEVALVGAYRAYRAASLALRWVVLTLAALSLARLMLTVPLALAHGRRRRAPGPGPAPSVAVVVPAHNEEAVLGAALAALTSLPPECAPAEVIVVDDGSTDATAEIAAGFGVHLIRQAQAGKAAALNAGIAAATSEVVVVIDADTVVTPALVPALAGHFRDARVGAVAGNVKVGNRGRLLPLLQAGEYLAALNLDRRAQDQLGVIPIVPGAAGAFRRGALAEVGGYPQATLVEDADLTVLLLRAGWQVRYEPAAVAWTEAPERVRDVLRQRRRWAYGTLQVLHRHADAFGGRRHVRLGWLGLPWTFLAQVLLPLAAPLADVYLLGQLAQGAVGPVTGVLALAAAADVAVIAAVTVAEREDWRLVAVAPLARWVWRPLLVLAVLGATRAWLADRPHTWVASRRNASVRVPARRRPEGTEPDPAEGPVPAGTSERPG